jgi:alkylation response protein AidB-like acyl-CoA dehydrogenase
VKIRWDKEIKEMDFEFNQEQKRFKEEIQRFLDKEVTEGVIQESEAGLGFGPHSWQLMRKLGERRWLAPAFPKEYGGLGLSYMYRYIVAEELDYRNALVLFRGFGSVGVDMVGPVILRYGSEEIKGEFLPRIARGEIELVLGYTEPDAGSDLSQISIRAVEDGNDFVITGQKTFNTACHFAQYHWLAARTDPDAPSHKGISMFIVDLETPGISINPMWEMGDARTNEVFYDEVRVPKKNLVGEKNKGWYYMTSALDLERMITVGGLERTFNDLVAYTKDTIRNGKPMAEDPLVRERLADLAIEISVDRNLVRRVAWLKDKEIVPNFESAVLKLFSCELYQRLANTGLEILGLYGQLRRGSKYAVIEGMMERFFRASFLMTIGGGTSEIMRSIIARRGLGLSKR